MSSMIYKRGQVWYWKDPIYGSKENGCQIHMGEAGLRYNRYVVIISAFDENSSFINPICMACTSNDENNESIPVTLSLNGLYSISYCNPNSIFPVNKKMLIRYVCTLSDEDMNKIDMMTMKFMLPNIYDKVCSDNSLRSILGLGNALENITISKHEAIEILNKDFKEKAERVQNFIDEYIEFTGNNNDCLNPYDLKMQYDKYCVKESFPVEFDIMPFISQFCHCIGSKSLLNAINQITVPNLASIINFNGLKFAKDVSISIHIDSSCNKISSISDTNKGKWTDEKIQEFMDLYNSKGPEVVEEVYGLKQSTINNYASKWKNLVNKESLFELTDPIGYIKKISAFSNLCGLIVNQEAKSLIQLGKKYSKNSLKFRNDVTTTCFFASIMFLGIKYECGNGKETKYIFPEINNDMKYIDTFRYIDSIADIINDTKTKKALSENEASTVLTKMRKLYPNLIIDDDWFEFVSNRMKGQFGKNNAIVINATLERILKA